MSNLNSLHSPSSTAKESEVNTRSVPYTTSTGVQIGCMYQPKQSIVVGRDMELLQTALLAKRTVRPGFFERLVRLVRNRTASTL